MQESATPRPDGPIGLLAISAWFGLFTALIEVAGLTVWLQIEGSAVLGALQLSRHYAWMIPLSHLVIFTCLGIPAAIVSLFRPEFARRLALFVSVFLAAFSLLSMFKGLNSLAGAVLALGLAYQAARKIDTRGRMFRKVVYFGLPIMLGLAGLCAFQAFDRIVLHERRELAALPKAVRGTPNVLLIVLDTVPANRTSLHGFGRDTTPNLRRIAERGVKFNQARSTAPWTLPSHASIFTGRWPHELGLEDGHTLDHTWPTLAEEMKKRGYATSGFVGNTYYCNSWYGLARGFLHYEDYYEENVLISPEEALKCTALGRWVIRLLGTSYLARPESVHFPKDAARVKHDFLRWLDDHSDRPFFTFLNYIDAHDPYQPPIDRTQHFGMTPETAADLEMIRSWHLVNKSKVSPRDLTLINDAYDDCLSYIDEQVGLLLDELDRRGTLKNTVLIITADHGEQFGDKKLFCHGGSLYEPEVHVPLIVLGPKGVSAGQVVKSPVTLRDLPATVLDLIGASAKSGPFPGRSLSRFWNAGALDGSDPILSEVDATMKIAKKPVWPPSQRGPMASLIMDGHTYIRDGMGNEELFHLDEDPEERKNLVGSPELQPLLNRLRAEFKRLVPTDGHRK